MNQKSKRIYYLDRIKILLCLLVIGLHTTIAYGGTGDWFFKEEVHDDLINAVFTIYDAVCQSFFMGLFFFISAYFTVPSYNKKGCRHFLKDRAVRLFIPVGIFYFILHPTTNFIVEKMSLKKSISYFEFMYDSIINGHNLGFGPLWFVFALIIFSIAYVLYRRISPNGTIQTEGSKKLNFPGKKAIFAFIIILGIISFAVRLVFPASVEIIGLKLGYFPQYIALFALGTIFYENNWLDEITDKISSLYFRASMICFVLLIIVLAIFMVFGDGNVDRFMGGMNLQAFVYALWEPFMCVGISFKLITVFRKKYDAPSDLWTGLSLDTYPVYVIHAPINVLIGCSLIGYAINPAVKCLVVYIATCVICFALSHFILRRVPVLRKIF